MALSTTHTLDGVEVVPGLLVWDYDLRARRVVRIAYTDHGNPWWELEDPVTEERGSDMDASRMWVYHPSNGRKVRV